MAATYIEMQRSLQADVPGPPTGRTTLWFEDSDDTLMIARDDGVTVDKVPIRGAAVADLGLTISNPPTQAEVQAVSDKVDALLAVMRTAFQLEP